MLLARREGYWENLDCRPAALAQWCVANLLYLAVPLILLVLVLPPLLVLLLASLRPAAAMPLDAGPLTLANYVHLLSDGEVLQLALNTLGFAACSLALGLSWLCRSCG